MVINNFSKYLSQIKPKWITYLSATSVYGNHNGAWVDEKSETNPTSENGIQRLVAENLWLSTCKNLIYQFKYLDYLEYIQTLTIFYN